MSEQVFKVLSSGTAVTGNRNVTPEELGKAVALIPLLAFPLLPPRYSHRVVFWSSILNLWSYVYNFEQWVVGASYTHLPDWVVCVTILSWLLGRQIVYGGPYTEWRQDDGSWSGYVVCGLVSFHFATLGGYFISFDNLLTWENIALLLVWCTITVLSVPRIFATLRKPFSRLFFDFTTRRVPLLFCLDQFAIQTHADVEAGTYTEVNSQSGSNDDDASSEFTGVTVEETESDVENEADETASQGARDGGEPDTRRRAVQGDEDNHEWQYIHLARQSEPYSGGDFEYFEPRFEPRFGPSFEPPAFRPRSAPSFESLFESSFRSPYGPTFEQPFEQRPGQRSGHEAGQHHQSGGIIRNTVEEKHTLWGMISLGFVCVSVPLLLALQYIALN